MEKNWKKELKYSLYYPYHGLYLLLRWRYTLLINTPKTLPINKKEWFNDFKKYHDPEFKKQHALLQSRFKYSPIDIKKYQTSPYFIGFDTETYASNGNLLCLCTSVGSTLFITGYETRQPSFKYIFNFFSTCKMSPKAIFVAYNLKFDAEVILKTLGEKVLTKFYRDDKFQGEYDGYKIKYIPKKFLSIQKDKETLMFFDALQFFIGSGVDGKTDLDSVAKLWLGKQKQYDGKYQNKVFPSHHKITNEELDKIVQYCYKDSCLVKNLMDKWVGIFHDNFKFYPDKYYSAGYLTSQYYKTQLQEFYSFTDIPYVVNELSYKCYFGGHFEIFQRGGLKNIHHYDIKSAYPHAMAKLPDLNIGHWHKMKNILEIYQSKLGFFEIETEINENYLAPFLLRQLSGLVICPTGKIRTHVTLDELKIALEYYDIKPKNISGYIFKEKLQTCPTPKTEFNKLIQNMYNMRTKQTNEGQKYVYKVLLNAGYGKFAQTKPEIRGLFNPVICAYITGHCRAKLLDAVKKNKNDIVMLATDGIFSTKKLPLKIGKNMGNLDYQFHPEMKLIQAGVYATNTKEDKTLKAHSRGFALKIIENGITHIFDFDETSIQYDKQHGFHFSITNQKPVSLVQSVIQKAYNPKLISMMTRYTKHIELNGDKKRTWLDTLKNFDTVNYSVPIEG